MNYGQVYYNDVAQTLYLCFIQIQDFECDFIFENILLVQVVPHHQSFHCLHDQNT